MSENLNKILLALCGLLTLGLGFVGYQVYNLQHDVQSVQLLMAKQLEDVKETAASKTQLTAQDRKYQEQLAEARRTLQAVALKAGAEAERKAEIANQGVANVAEQQKVIAEQTKTEIGAVKAETKSAQEKIGQVSGDVAAVRTDLSSTKSTLDQTIANLKTVQGDLSSTGSLVATNGKEIEALRMLGQRNIVEFKVPKSEKQGVLVGDVRLTLKKSDQKRNRFTLEVLADDKRTEKKDKTINEPIQFYTSHARQPYEIVVNQVGKDLVVGYLSTPKVRDGR